MAEKKTLLGLDRLPTLEEMQDFFKDNDWTAAKIFTEPELADAVSHGKELLAPVMEKVMQEHGLGVWSGYFDNKVRVNGTTFQQNPLIAFRDNFEDLVMSIVAKLQYETPEEAQQIIDQIKESNIDSDELLSFMVNLALDVTEFKESAHIIYRHSDSNDFNPYITRNYRASDHRKKWNHTRAKLEIIFCSNRELKKLQSTVADPEHEAIFNILVEEFVNALDETDKKIFYLKKEGYMQSEVSKILGFANNSTVSKRLKKMRELFREITGY